MDMVSGWIYCHLFAFLLMFARRVKGVRLVIAASPHVEVLSKIVRYQMACLTSELRGVGRRFLGSAYTAPVHTLIREPYH